MFFSSSVTYPPMGMAPYCWSVTALLTIWPWVQGSFESFWWWGRTDGQRHVNCAKCVLPWVWNNQYHCHIHSELDVTHCATFILPNFQINLPPKLAWARAYLFELIVSSSEFIPNVQLHDSPLNIGLLSIIISLKTIADINGCYRWSVNWYNENR